MYLPNLAKGDVSGTEKALKLLLCQRVHRQLTTVSTVDRSRRQGTLSLFKSVGCWGLVTR